MERCASLTVVAVAAWVGAAAGPGRASGIEASRLEIQRRENISVGPSLQTLNDHLVIATGHTASRILAA